MMLVIPNAEFKIFSYKFSDKTHKLIHRVSLYSIKVFINAYKYNKNRYSTLYFDMEINLRCGLVSFRKVTGSEQELCIILQ